MNIGEGEHPWSLPADLETDALSGHVPPAIAQVLVRRGIDTPQRLSALLDPPHKLPYDPLRITGMVKSGAVIVTKAEMNANGRYSDIKLGSMM